MRDQTNIRTHQRKKTLFITKRENMKFYQKAILLIVATSLIGCAAAVKTPENTSLSPKQPRSLYLVVERNPRLPGEFLTVLKQETQKRLPDANITVDEGGVDDQALARADWIIALRATRIMPNYSFKPTNNSTANGITDCLIGSGAGPGVIIAPCLYSTDHDFLEASIRDVSGKTLKTYIREEAGESWLWLLPISAIQAWLTGKDQHQVWLDLIDTLYDKMLGDGVFNNSLPLTVKQE